MMASLRLIPACVIVGLIAAGSWLRADEARLEGHDLQIQVDWQWVGGDSGGYFPLRIEAANKGAARDVEFAFVCRDAGCPGARRTLKLDAGATTRFTLLVPLARERASGQFVVSIAGEPLEGLARSMTLPDLDPGDIRPAILVVSRLPLNPGPLERALQSANGIWMASPPAGTFPAASWGATLATSWSSRPSNHGLVAPDALPETWLGFSTVDMVIVTRDDFSALQAGQRRALLDWTVGGGTLIVTTAGQLPGEDLSLAELLGQSPAAWIPAERRHQPRVEVAETVPRGQDPRRPFDLPVPEDGIAEVVQDGQVQWPMDPLPFAIRPNGLGQMVVIRDDPFAPGPGAAAAEDWLWLLMSLPMRDLSWAQRHGGSSRTMDSRFLEFLIPGQRSVPVGAMLIMVTLFTLAIGPLNYWLAWHRRRLSLLLITVPGFALATTLLLFLYSLVAFGFTTEARIRSLTVLDQTSQTAATIARVSLYSPFAPGNGPVFSADTEVTPRYGPGGMPRLDSIDWTERQQLGPGWLRSRTRTQFLTITPHIERRRLEIRPTGSTGLSLSNGFEVGLQAVLASDDRGGVFVGRTVPAGGTVELDPADDVSRRAFLRDWQSFALELPDELNQDLVENALTHRRSLLSSRRWNRPPLVPASAPGLLEDLWGECGRLIESDQPLPPRTFLVILSSNPGISTGLARVVEHGSIHVLRGTY
jgi:hypothetical protein